MLGLTPLGLPTRPLVQLCALFIPKPTNVRTVITTKTKNDTVVVHLKPGIPTKYAPHIQRDTATAAPVGLFPARPMDLLNNRNALPTDTTKATTTAGPNSGMATS